MEYRRRQVALLRAEKNLAGPSPAPSPKSKAERSLRLVIAGDGPERAPLHDLARRMNLAEARAVPGLGPRA